MDKDKIEFKFDDDNFTNRIYDSKQIFGIDKTKHKEMIDVIEKQIKILENSLSIFDKDELFFTVLGIQFQTVLPFVETESDKANLHFDEFFFNKEVLSLFSNSKYDNTTNKIKHVAIDDDNTHAIEITISCKNGSFFIELDNQLYLNDLDFNSDIFKKAEEFYKRSFSYFENDLIKPIAKKLNDIDILDIEFLINGTRK